MSKLQELIEKHCPDGVEYKALGELGVFYGGLTGKNKNDFGEGAAFVQYTTVYNNASVEYYDLGRVRIEPGENQNSIQVGDVLFTVSSENREDCGMSSVVVEEPPEVCYLNSFCTGLRLSGQDLLPDFMKHLMRNEEVRKQIRKCCSGVTRFNLSKPKLLRVRIPIPPIEVQREIVRLLDAYTAAHDALVAKLNEEIELTEEQRHQVLESFIKSFIGASREYKPLNSFVAANQKISYGIVQPGEDGTGDMGVLRPVDINDSVVSFEGIKYIDREIGANYSRTELAGGEILIVVRGATGEIAIAPDECRGMNVTRGIAVLRPDETQIAKQFLFDCLLSDTGQAFIRKNTRGTALMQINIRDLESMPIPVLTAPEMDEYLSRRGGIQSAITALLSQAAQLQEEVRLREAQLTEFRNQLLSFPEKAA